MTININNYTNFHTRDIACLLRSKLLNYNNFDNNSTNEAAGGILNININKSNNIENFIITLFVIFFSSIYIGYTHNIYIRNALIIVFKLIFPKLLVLFAIALIVWVIYECIDYIHKYNCLKKNNNFVRLTVKEKIWFFSLFSFKLLSFIILLYFVYMFLVEYWVVIFFLGTKYMDYLIPGLLLVLCTFYSIFSEWYKASIEEKFLSFKKLFIIWVLSCISRGLLIILFSLFIDPTSFILLALKFSLLRLILPTFEYYFLPYFYLARLFNYFFSPIKAQALVSIYDSLSTEVKNKQNSLIVSGLGSSWENLYREAISKYNDIFIKQKIQLEKVIDTELTVYFKNVTKKTLSFFLDMDEFLNLFLPRNIKMDNIRFNAFFENLMKEKGLLKEVSTTNKLSLTKLDVWKLIAPMFTSSQVNFFYPPTIQGLIEVVPMHQKIVVSNGIDYRVNLDKELNSGKLWITSTRIADDLTKTKCLTLSQLVLWKVNCSISNDKFSFWSKMQSNSTAYKGSIQLIKLGKPDLPNLDMVEEKSAGTIFINPNWAVEKAVDVFCKKRICTDFSIPHPKIGIAKNPSVSMGLRGGGYSFSNISVNYSSTNDSSSNSDNIVYDDTMSGALAEGEELQEMEELQEIEEWIDPALYYRGTLIDGRPIIDPFDSYDFVIGEESNLDSENNGSNALYLNSYYNNTNNPMQNEPVDTVENESIVFKALGEGLEEIYGGDYPSPGIDGGDESQDCPDYLQDSAQQVKQFVSAQSNSEHPNPQFSDKISLSSDNSSLSSHNTAEFKDIWDSDLTIREFKNFFFSVANEELFSTELYSKFIEDFNSIEGISSMVINNNMEKSSQDGIIDLSFEGIVSRSKNVISRLTEEFRQNNFIDTTISSAENQVKKTHKGSWLLYTRTAWYNSKERFHRSLGAKRFAHLSDKQKEDFTFEFYAQHKKLGIELYKNRSSDEYLKDLSVRIQGLVKNLLNLENRTWCLREKSISKKIRSLRIIIMKIQSNANKLIKTSNLNNKIKDILLKQVKEIITNMYGGINIGNQIDHAYLNELENKIKDLRGILVKKSQLICKDNLRVITQNQFKPGNFYPTTKQSLLIAEFHKCLRDEILYKLKARLHMRIELSKKYRLIENEKLVKSELNGEFDFLNKNLYTMPSLQDVCLHLLQELIKLNNKYYYICNKKFILCKNNYFIYIKLKEIIIRFTKKHK